MRRKTIFDTLDGPFGMNFNKLSRNVRVVAETLARHLYKLHRSEYVFIGDKVSISRFFGSDVGYVFLKELDYAVIKTFANDGRQKIENVEYHKLKKIPN